MRIRPSACAIALFASAWSCHSSAGPPPQGPAAPASAAATGETFASCEAAMLAVAAVAGTGDKERAQAIFGAGSLEVLGSGDEAADRANGERVREMIRERLAFEDAGPDRKRALIGSKAWRFAIPLVHAGDGWRFDLDGGKEELLNRRIGRNELFALETLRSCIDAEQEYRAQATDGHIGYAHRFRSTDGKHDGLYWPSAEGGARSPIGELLAAAAIDDPAGKTTVTPLHGYCYRILHCQGRTAPGGERNFVDHEGHMTGGCGVLAWPATYGNSGVMTFMVNHVGIVFEKDLGPETAAVARAITSFDPDATWKPVRD